MSASIETQPPERKALLEHRLAVWRIVYEKGLLGFLLLLAGFIASILIERYKANITQEKFVLEKRLEGAQAIADAYGELADLAYQCGTGKGNEQTLEKYQTSIQEYCRQVNRWDMLFSEDVRKQFEYHTWLHDGIATGDVQVTKEHWPFLMAVFESLDSYLTRSVNLESNVLEHTNSFRFKEVDLNQMGDMPGHKFFEIQLNEWKKLHR